MNNLNPIADSLEKSIIEMQAIRSDGGNKKVNWDDFWNNIEGDE